jgi:hypothetical protein
MNEWQRQEKQEKIGKSVIGTIVIIVLSLAIIFGGAFLQLKFNFFWKTESAKIDRAVHEESKSYVDGKINDLSNYYHEYQTYVKQDDEEGQAIVIGAVQSQFNNFKSHYINNADLRNFLEDCLSGRLD